MYLVGHQVRWAWVDSPRVCLRAPEEAVIQKQERVAPILLFHLVFSFTPLFYDHAIKCLLRGLFFFSQINSHFC